MKRRASSIAEKMIKVDHAGENGAVNIYRAQSLAANLRCPKLKPQIKEFQRHEEEHRRIFKEHLDLIGVRRCMSYHFTGAGGFLLGIVTGFIGPRAIAATTYAVESVVLEHLEHQLSDLELTSPDAYCAVKSIYDDEKEHHDQAKSQSHFDEIMTKIIVRTVQNCTQAVIRFGMR
jgi:ubiquinone biosynthesis monooxygenase Coq7